MRVFLDFLGCRLNESELSSWRRYLTKGGHQLVSNPSDADVMTLNTCAVTGAAARKSRRLLRSLARKNPTARLVATGCYASLEPEKTADLLGVDLVVPNKDKDRLAQLIIDKFSDQAMPKMAQLPDSQPAFNQTRTRAFIKIQDGCRNKCSYCIVTIARGEEKSRRPEEILSEINHLHEIGYQEVVLTGVHLGGYGTEINTNMKKLVQKILKETDIPRIRIGSLEPWDLPEDFFSLWENSRLCPHLHLPLQSGSNTVLRRMIRRCTVEEYKKIVDRARLQNPDFHISSDLIIGFPGETEAEFEESMKNIEEIEFGNMHLFTFSARTGTAAARMKGRIPKELAQKRHMIAKKIVTRNSHKYLNSQIGKSRLVLWERDVEALGDGTFKWKGYTDNYLRVQAISTEKLFNRITPANLLKMDDSGGMFAETGSLKDNEGNGIHN